MVQRPVWMSGEGREMHQPVMALAVDDFPLL
jgi:hypothetical protein